MSKSNRALFQILFWSVIWSIMGVSQEGFIRFFSENWLAYFFQPLLIIALINVLAPQFLFKKKHLQFVLISIVTIVLFAFISSQLVEGERAREAPERLHMPPPNNRPEGLNMPPPPPSAMGKKNVPSPFFINFLLIKVAYFLRILVEAFSLAQKKEEDLILSKSETMETELKFLKSQINPHFLFNALNNIYALSAIDAQKTQDSILYLSDMLRYVLYECEKPKVEIAKEITYIEDFIKLFELKSSRKYPIKTDFSINNPSLQIAPMLLIPFVENAFKHSNIHNPKESFITIKIETIEEQIIFSIENSLNKEPVAKDKVGGIGIRNVQKRLSLLYPNKHDLRISQNEESYIVELKIDSHV